MSTILITGSSGFIGFHVAQQLLALGHHVIGIDNENDYYDVQLKKTRREILCESKQFIFHHASIEDFSSIQAIFTQHKPDRVLHLAAQAGVRYSIENPFCYIQTNLVGFHNVIECAKQHHCKHFVYASSASVYGGNISRPFRTTDPTEQPLSLYGATKKANELIAHSYHSMFDMHVTGLRFFNVYGPRGRPDGAFFIFLKNITEGIAIDVFNYGESLRNFTYIDDIVRAVTTILFNDYACEIFNLGNTRQITLLYMIDCLEKSLGKHVEKNLLPASLADIAESDVDISHTQDTIGWVPTVDIEEGVANLSKRYTSYYHSAQ